MLLALSSAVLSTPTTSKPTRKERRTIQIGDTYQKTIVVPGKPPCWIDVTKIENEDDIKTVKRLCVYGVPNHWTRVVGVRNGKRYAVAGFGIGKPA